MRIFLIRHAAAEDRDRKRWPDDRQRPLTPDGMRKFRKAAAGLGRFCGPIDRLLASPLVRAQQTAVLLSEVAAWPAAVETPELAPGRTAAPLLRLLRELGLERVALVGHEPELTQMLAVAVAGSQASLACELKKGAAIALSFAAEPRPGQGRLEWLATPRMLRALSKEE